MSPGRPDARLVPPSWAFRLALVLLAVVTLLWARFLVVDLLRDDRRQVMWDSVFVVMNVLLIYLQITMEERRRLFVAERRSAMALQQQVADAIGRGDWRMALHPDEGEETTH